MKRTPCHRFFFYTKNRTSAHLTHSYLIAFVNQTFVYKIHTTYMSGEHCLILYTFSFTTICFGFLGLLDFGFGASGSLDSVELSAALDGDSWGGGVPMDLVCLHGTGGDSGSYTKSLSGSSHSVGVGSCLKHLPTLGFVS